MGDLDLVPAADDAQGQRARRVDQLHRGVGREAAHDLGVRVLGLLGRRHLAHWSGQQLAAAFEDLGD